MTTFILSLARLKYLVTLTFDGDQSVAVRLVQMTSGIRFEGVIHNANANTIQNITQSEPRLVLNGGFEIVLCSNAHQCGCVVNRDMPIVELRQKVDCLLWLVDRLGMYSKTINALITNRTANK